MSAVLILIFWPRVRIEPFELACNFRFYIDLRGSRNAAQQNGREPKQDKGSGEHGNQQYGLHSKWLS